MIALRALISRNCKLFFKDKSVFFPSLIAPLILLFLFIAFLGDVYRDSIRNVVEGFPISDGLVESIAAGWLVSSLVAVSAVTISFSANCVMVSDRVHGQANDIFVTPARRSFVALAYFISTFLVTAAICTIALAAGFVYIGIAGWHLTAWDVIGAFLDMLLLVLFGTALSSIVNRFIKSQGGVAAVQTIVSSAYGFLCGAYMPLSQLAVWLRRLLTFLPGTYGTVLMHAHLMGSAMEAVTDEGMPAELAEGLKSGFDCKLDFFGTDVPEWVCFLVLVGAVLLFTGIHVFLCAYKKKARRK